MDKKTKFVIIIFVSVLFFYVFKEIRSKYLLSICSKYTIGKVIDVTRNNRSSLDIGIIEYCINSKHYMQRSMNKKSNVYQGSILYLRFACDNPTIIEGIWDKKVDSLHLKNLPPEGWDKLPE